MLAGNLKEFTLPDIFQLLMLTKKSGALCIAHGSAEGRVYFAEGEVYFALSDDRRMPLGARLVASGHLQAERLQQLLRDHRGGTGIEVAADLMSSEEIDTATLENFVRDQLHDALYSLLRLEEGEFEFDSEAGVGWPGPHYSATEALEEAHRRVDEAARLASHTPADTAVPALVPNPPGGAPLALDRDQWRMVTLVDGKRTVAELIDLSGKGEFAGARVIAELIEAGLLEANERPGEGALAELLAGRHALRQLEEVALGADGLRRAGGRHRAADRDDASTADGGEPPDDADEDEAAAETGDDAEAAAEVEEAEGAAADDTDEVDADDVASDEDTVDGDTVGEEEEEAQSEPDDEAEGSDSDGEEEPAAEDEDAAAEDGGTDEAAGPVGDGGQDEGVAQDAPDETDGGPEIIPALDARSSVTDVDAAMGQRRPSWLPVEDEEEGAIRDALAYLDTDTDTADGEDGDDGTASEGEAADAADEEETAAGEGDTEAEDDPDGDTDPEEDPEATSDDEPEPATADDDGGERDGQTDPAADQEAEEVDEASARDEATLYGGPSPGGPKHAAPPGGRQDRDPSPEETLGADPAHAGTEDDAEDDAEDADSEQEEAPAAAGSSGSGAAAPRTFDRAQVARELASLGLDDDDGEEGPPKPVKRTPANGRPGTSAAPRGEDADRLSRDEDINRGLLLRLIDGVKGA